MKAEIFDLKEHTDYSNEGSINYLLAGRELVQALAVGDKLVVLTKPKSVIRLVCELTEADRGKAFEVYQGADESDKQREGYTFYFKELQPGKEMRSRGMFSFTRNFSDDTRRELSGLTRLKEVQYGE